ncbi:MotA/TolQ/ExbB proton channel family protein, partial [bacterium]
SFIIERWVYFRSVKLSSKKVMDEVEKHIKKNAFDKIVEYCGKNITPLTATIKAIVENREKPREELEEIVDIVRAQQRIIMEKFMVILGSISAIAPLLGLLGTVTGIIKAFADLAKSGSGGPAVVAAGVSEALVTTAFGLLVAIPVLYAYNYYNNRIKNTITDIDVNSRIFFFMLKETK